MQINEEAREKIKSFRVIKLTRCGKPIRTLRCPEIRYVQDISDYLSSYKINSRKYT